MSWLEISVTVPHEYVEPVSYLFSRYGRSLTLEPQGPDRVLLRTYLPATSRQRLARIEVGVRLVSAIQPIGEMRVVELPEGEDWEQTWKSHFGVLRAGRRLVIRPTWIEYQPGPGEVVVEMDPGMAFGTGYHPTTHTCLEALEQMVRPGASVLDLGTGSGILAISAVLLGAADVVALDIDPQAVRAARQNLRRTRTAQRVTLALGSLPHPTARPEQFDLAVANISARAIRERAQFILPTLRPAGAFVASGMTTDQRQEVVDALKPLGHAPIQEWRQDEWLTLVFRRDALRP